MMRPRLALLLALSLVLAPFPVAAQQAAGWVDAFGLYQHVGNGFGDWKGGGVRAQIPIGSTIWYLEGLGQEAFGDEGAFGSIGARINLSSDWYTTLGVGGGSGDFFFPDLRLDGTISRILLPSRRLIVTTGVTWVDAKQGFEDLSLSGSLAAYVGGTVLEAGGRWNRSLPGSVTSGRGFASLTTGADGRSWVTVRGSVGTEGYVLTGTAATLRRFTSYEGSLTWRQWISGGFGVRLQGDLYDNPFYTRAGGNIGLFASW